MFSIRIEPDKYNTRTFPFTFADVANWMAELPVEHTHGLTVIVCDAHNLGQGPYPLSVRGHYLISTEKRIGSDDPEATVKIFTVPVRYLKRGPVYTVAKDVRSWVKSEMADLEKFLRYVLHHEVGHYMTRRLFPHLSAGPFSEISADAYARDPIFFVEVAPTTRHKTRERLLE